MLCIPEQLFIMLNLRGCLYDWFHSLKCTGFQRVICFICLSLISQHTVAVFYLHSPIPCIEILIKDNTGIVFIWSSLLGLYVHDRVANFLRTFELFDGIFP